MTFDEWLKADTEFTKEEFFSKVREIMACYDLEVCEDGDCLIFNGETTDYQVSDYDEDGRMKTRIVKLPYKAVAKYDSRMCSMDSEVSGHGEHFGSGSPYKTYKDLSRLCAPYGDLLPKKDYEQLTLF